MEGFDTRQKLNMRRQLRNRTTIPVTPAMDTTPTPTPTPLERIGVPVDAVRDLLALHGGGSFRRQIGTTLKREAVLAVVGLINLVVKIVIAIVVILSMGTMMVMCSLISPPSQSPTADVEVLNPPSSPSPSPTATPTGHPAPRAILVRLPEQRHVVEND